MDEIDHTVKRDMVDYAFNAGRRISDIRKLYLYDVDLYRGATTIVNPKNKNTVEVELNKAALNIIQRQDKNNQHLFSK